MDSLRRHHLAHLAPAGWRSVLQQSWSAQQRACLAHWSAHDLPLVVGRQPAPVEPLLHLGLPAPIGWGRLRMSLQVGAVDVARFAVFPFIEAVLPLLPAAHRDVVEGLAERHPATRVYGSFGWQQLTGLVYVHPASDIDLLVPTTGAAAADVLAAGLAAADGRGPRLDGEFVFADGSAVAWREWLAWRAGRLHHVLVKRIDGVALESGSGWVERACRGAGRGTALGDPA